MQQVIIVGSGPAGYTAAIYTARAGLRRRWVDRRRGALMTTTEVENSPAPPPVSKAPELMAQLRELAERFGARIPDGAIALSTL